MITLRRETATDSAEVEYLFDVAFAPGRSALSSYRLRDGVAPVSELCFVARDEGDLLAGALRQWPIRIGDAPALLVGPIAVHPTRQGEGLGAILIEESMAASADAGWTIAILIGDAPYYRRFGFRPVAGDGISFPPPTNPQRILARALVPGALTGVSGPVRKWTG